MYQFNLHLEEIIEIFYKKIQPTILWLQNSSQYLNIKVISNCSYCGEMFKIIYFYAVRKCVTIDPFTITWFCAITFKLLLTFIFITFLNFYPCINVGILFANNLFYYIYF